jgi:arabinosaccharide transport system substrate-binding protein
MGFEPETAGNESVSARSVIENFPYGKAPFWLLVLSLASSLILLAKAGEHRARSELVFATFTKPHFESYARALPEFERRHGIKVTLELVNQRSLETRLQNAMLAGADVPDLVEIEQDQIGFFIKGALSDIRLLDLTERIEQRKLRQAMVESRFSLWSTRGHTFALPHDVHPVMLGYRADLIAQLGIDVDQLKTWDDFVKMGQRVTRDTNGDGVPDRYAIDLPQGGFWGLSTLLLQRGVGLFDAAGQLAFNTPITVDTIVWYIHQTRGSRRIAYECGWGQSLAKAMEDGLALFFIMPDWRTRVTEQEEPSLAGKMKLMPLPAWEQGGRRTSTWGGTGLTITKSSKHPELAWELAQFLYLNKSELGPRFAATNVLPPFKDAWDLPEFSRPNPFFSGQPLGAMYAQLAPETPPVWATPYSRLADERVNEAYLRAARYFDAHGDDGLRGEIEHELAAAGDYISLIMKRNVLASGVQ